MSVLCLCIEPGADKKEGWKGGGVSMEAAEMGKEEGIA